MNNRSAGPRSFNTIQRSNRGARLRRLQEMRILLLAICALILLLALTGLVFLFCHLGHSLSAGGGGGGSSGKIVYTKITQNAVDVHAGDLIQIDGDHFYQFPETAIEDLADKSAYDMNSYLSAHDGKPYAIRNAAVGRIYLQPTAASAMDRMLTAFYESTGEALAFYDGYRSYAYQKDLWDRNSSKVKAGCSDQHTGLSAWITNTSNGEPTNQLRVSSMEQLIRIGKTYGFIQRYPESKKGETGIDNYPELFRYVGIPHAMYITGQNLTLESYLKQLQNSHTYSGTHLLLDANGNQVTKDAAYEIYYVAVSGDSASVPVPKNYNYTISGDNIGGFIVTVNLNSPK